MIEQLRWQTATFCVALMNELSFLLARWRSLLKGYLNGTEP